MWAALTATLSASGRAVVSRQRPTGELVMELVREKRQDTRIALVYRPGVMLCRPIDTLADAHDVSSLNG
jgi:hypothetical protein